jgi:sugar O-acyltransferase (sialic acid O-acetyltransferase NeuD family)
VPPVAIIGAGGHARETLDIFEAVNEGTPTWQVLGWLVESAFAGAGTLVNGHPILGDLGWLAGRTDGLQLVCAVGDPGVRRRLVLRAQSYGGRFCSVVHPRASVGRWVRLGEGVVVAAGAVVTNGVVLGDHVHVNVGCTVSHDVTCAAYSTLSPGVHVAGRVQVGEGAFLGIGASLIPDVVVGAWSVVGAGAVITRDVPPNSTVVGVPARVVRERSPGWQEG